MEQRIVGPPVTKQRLEETDTVFAEQDNWKHRSEKMKCETCMFFVEKKRNKPGLGNIIGRCRALAPTMKGWPVMFPSDWCGGHKLDEEKMEPQIRRREDITNGR